MIDPEPWWDPQQAFTGGDHLHLCVPRSPDAPVDGYYHVSSGTAMPIVSPWKVAP